MSATLVALCENGSWNEDWQRFVPCRGRLRFQWGMTEAACDTCGGRCGIAVAAWTQVVRGATR